MAIVAMVLQLHEYHCYLYQLAFDKEVTDAARPFPFWALVEGAAISGGLILAFNYFYLRQSFQHPGHWILLQTALYYLSETPLYVADLYHFAYRGSISIPYSHAAYVLASQTFMILIFAAWIAATAVAAKHFEKWWTLCFGMFLAKSLGVVVAAIFFQQVWAFVDSPIMPLILLLTLLGTIVYDAWTKGMRDWLHWFGILVAIQLAARQLYLTWWSWSEFTNTVAIAG